MEPQAPSRDDEERPLATTERAAIYRIVLVPNAVFIPTKTCRFSIGQFSETHQAEWSRGGGASTWQLTIRSTDAGATAEDHRSTGVSCANRTA